MQRRRRVWVLAAAAVAIAGAVAIASGGPAAAAKPLAKAELRNAAGAPVGTVWFEGKGHHAEWVRVELALPSGAPNPGAFHGFHIHAVGSCAPSFAAAGGHWNLSGEGHGGHTGDLPSVLVGPDGSASARFETHRFDVNQLFDADGSAVILHADPDNFGNVPRGAGQYADPNGFYDSSTRLTGDAGARYACGVVEPR